MGHRLAAVHWFGVVTHLIGRKGPRGLKTVSTSGLLDPEFTLKHTEMKQDHSAHGVQSSHDGAFLINNHNLQKCLHSQR